MNIKVCNRVTLPICSSAVADATPSPYSVVRKSPTVLLLEFSLADTGAYSLDAHLRGVRVQGCPLLFKAYDAQRIHLQEVDKNVEVNEIVTLHGRFIPKNVKYSYIFYTGSKTFKFT